MLDKWSISWVKPALKKTAIGFDRVGLAANQVTIIGFIIGMVAVPAIWKGYYLPALLFIIINRIFDGLDGELARLNGVSNTGAYLDITLDFIFYAGIVWGFALSNPQINALASATLIFSFIGTGVSFLAFAIIAAKQNIERLNYPKKSFYYLGGLTEGTETIAAFFLFCLFPEHFPILAYIFSGMCWITIFFRIIGGYTTIKQTENQLIPQNKKITPVKSNKE